LKFIRLCARITLMK